MTKKERTEPPKETKEVKVPKKVPVVDGYQGSYRRMAENAEGHFSNKSRVVADPSVPGYFGNGTAPFSHKSRVVRDDDLTPLAPPKTEPVIPSFSEKSKTFNADGTACEANGPGEEFANSYLREYKHAVASFSESSVVVGKY